MDVVAVVLALAFNKPFRAMYNPFPGKEFQVRGYDFSVMILSSVSMIL